MNIIFLGSAAVRLPAPNVIHVVDEFDFLRLLKLDPKAFGVFMCKDRQEGQTLVRNVRVDDIKNPLYCLMYGPDADHTMVVNILGAGADQVERFPVDERLFAAQLLAIEGRCRPAASTRIRFGSITFDPQTGDMWSPSGKVYLTTHEGRLLQILTGSADRTISKKLAHQMMYGDSPDAPGLKIIDVFMVKIRKKISRLSNLDYIETTWGRGFTFISDGFAPAMVPYRAPTGRFLNGVERPVKEPVE